MKISTLTLFVFLLFVLSKLSGQTIIKKSTPLTPLKVLGEDRSRNSGIYSTVLDSFILKNNYDLPITHSLNVVSGIFMQQGTSSTNRLTIRGLGSRSPYNTRGVQVFLDGIPMTSSNGFSSIEDIPVTFLKNIRVTKGPSASSSGNGLAGSVFLNTVKQDKLSLSTLHLPWNTHNISAGSNFKTGKINWNIGIQMNKSNGYRENNAHERNSYFIQPSYSFKKHTLKFTHMSVNVFSGIPSSLNYVDFIANPQSAASNWNSIKGHEQYQNLINGLHWNYQITSDINNSLILFYNYRTGNEVRPFNKQYTENSSWGLRNKSVYNWENWHFIHGLDYNSSFYHLNTYKINPKSDGLISKVMHENVSTFGEALYYNYPFRTSISLNYTYFRNSMETLLPKEKYALTNWSPSVYASYFQSVNTEWFISFSKGFGVPVDEEIVRSDGSLIHNLRPELGYQAELGIKLSSANKQHELNASLYGIILQDMFSVKRESEDLFYTINSGDAKFVGVEIAHKSIFKSSKYIFTIAQSVNASENRFKNYESENIDYSGKHLAGIPQFKYALNGEIRQKELGRLVISGQLIGSQYLNDVNTESYEGYTLINARLYRTIMNNKALNLELNIGVENILNEKYASMILVNAPSFNAKAPRYYYPGLPHYFFGGILFRLKA